MCIASRRVASRRRVTSRDVTLVHLIVASFAREQLMVRSASSRKCRADFRVNWEIGNLDVRIYRPSRTLTDVLSYLLLPLYLKAPREWNKRRARRVRLGYIRSDYARIVAVCMRACVCVFSSINLHPRRWISRTMERATATHRPVSEFIHRIIHDSDKLSVCFVFAVIRCHFCVRSFDMRAFLQRRVSNVLHIYIQVAHVVHDRMNSRRNLPYLITVLDFAYDNSAFVIFKASYVETLVSEESYKALTSRLRLFRFFSLNNEPQESIERVNFHRALPVFGQHRSVSLISLFSFFSLFFSSFLIAFSLLPSLFFSLVLFFFSFSARCGDEMENANKA